MPYTVYNQKYVFLVLNLFFFTGPHAALIASNNSGEFNKTIVNATITTFTVYAANRGLEYVHSKITTPGIMKLYGYKNVTESFSLNPLKETTITAQGTDTSPQPYLFTTLFKLGSVIGLNYFLYQHIPNPAVIQFWAIPQIAYGISQFIPDESKPNSIGSKIYYGYGFDSSAFPRKPAMEALKIGSAALMLKITHGNL